MTGEIIQIISVVTLLFGTWKVTEIAKSMGRIEAILDTHNDKFKEHDERLSRLERSDQATGRPDGKRPSGFGGRLAATEG